MHNKAYSQNDCRLISLPHWNRGLHPCIVIITAVFFVLKGLFKILNLRFQILNFALKNSFSWSVFMGRGEAHAVPDDRMHNDVTIKCVALSALFFAISRRVIIPVPELRCGVEVYDPQIAAVADAHDPMAASVPFPTQPSMSENLRCPDFAKANCASTTSSLPRVCSILYRAAPNWSASRYTNVPPIFSS